MSEKKIKIRRLEVENFPKFQGAFTLIELLVVIFIIGTLTGIILPNFVGSRQRARDSRRKQDLVDIKNALRMYYNDNQTYPAAGVLNFGSPFEASGEYMQQVPQDPLGDSNSYVYCVDANGDGFVLCADLENEGDGDNVEQSDSQCANICTCDCGDTESRCYFICAN